MTSKLLTNLVLCFVVSQTDSEKIILPADQIISINCSNGEELTIVNIDVQQTQTKCQQSQCNVTEIKEDIMSRCQGEKSCCLTPNTFDGCLQDYGKVNLFYTCIDRIFLCDFEDTSCTFITNWGAYRWKRKQVNITRGLDKGPLSDHTKLTGNGYYVIVSGSDGRQGKTAFLRSHPIHPHVNQCLSFWYFLHKNYSDKLFVRQEYYNRFSILLWTLSFDNPFGWHYQELTLKSERYPFNVSFKAVRGTGNGGYLALDDISVTNGNCNGTVFHKETCLNVSRPVIPQHCSNRNIDFQSLVSKFVPEYEECSGIYQNLKDDFLDECKDNKGRVCSLNTTQALQRRPECFMSNRIKVEYTCTDKTSTVGVTRMGKNTSNSSGINAHVMLNSASVNQSSSYVSRDKDQKVIYILVGSFALAVSVLCLVVWVVYSRRQRNKKRNSLLNDSHIRMNDYNDDLNGPLNTNVHNKAVSSAARTNVTCILDDTYTNIAMAGHNAEGDVYINSNQLQIDDAEMNNHRNSITKTEISQLTMETKYEILDSTATGYDRSGSSFEGNIYINANKIQSSVVDAGIKKHKKSTKTTKYEILDPTETGYDRSGITTEYELASSIFHSESNAEEDIHDLYVLTGDGVYDTSKNIRHVTDDDVNVYNQTLDNVYNTTSLEKKLDLHTYDHF